MGKQETLETIWEVLRTQPRKYEMTSEAKDPASHKRDPGRLPQV